MTAAILLSVFAFFFVLCLFLKPIPDMRRERKYEMHEAWKKFHGERK